MSRPAPFRTLRFAWRLLLLALLVGGWALAAAALHVVIVPDAEGITMPSFGSEDAGGGGNPQAEPSEPFKVLLVPKNRLGFRNTYTDTRPWTADDAKAHAALVGRLVEAGHGQRLGHVLDEPTLRRLSEMLERRRDVLGPVE